MSGGGPVLPRWGPCAGPSPDPDVGTTVQALLDVVPGQAVWAIPIRADTGETIDLEIRAAGPRAVDRHGRTGKELIGRRLLESYPSLRSAPLWEGTSRVLSTGEPEEIVRYEHLEGVAGVPRRMTYTVRLARVGDGLLADWVHADAQRRLEARLAQTERLGNLGWAHWSLVSGDVDWSAQLYVIHGRDPAEGPLDLAQYRTIVHPDDLAFLDEALVTLVRTGGPHEFEIRVRVGDHLRLLRIRLETSWDATGQPVEIHGVLQDITDWQQAADQLLAVRERLEEKSRLTAELQHIIMPVPDRPVAVPGLRVAARYDPAETSPLGGDWFQAIRLDDDEVVLAVGDVAGHGLPAASTMAKLRHAITGLAFAGHDPAQILVALNRLLRRMRPDVLATAVVAWYRRSDRTLTWTHAGHPPMLLVRGTRVNRLLHSGVLLGVFDDVHYTCATIPLRPDDLLVMYTDGLIERPGQDLYESLDALSETIAEVVRRAPADRLTAVRDTLTPSNPSDDTCVLIAQVVPDAG